MDEWLERLRLVHQRLTGGVEFNSIEPSVGVRVQLKDGRGRLIVRITPEVATQSHSSDYQIDQSHVAKLIASLERLLDRFSDRGEPD